MATPLTVSIPLLTEGQKIAEWEPKFRASVVSLDQKVAVRLLPAYVKRGRLEERVVLEAILKDTLDEAPDQFEAANTFRQLLWQRDNWKETSRQA